MDHDLEKYFTTCMDLVNQAAELIETAFHQAKRVDTKSCPQDLVTETDQEVEKLLINGLQLAFPNHRFIGEESTAGGVKCVLTDAPTWIIDPVDGTMNFVHTLPLIAISIGLLIDKKPVIGIICNPILKQTYTARVGQGAFLNGNRIKVSGETELAKALICTESGTSDDPAKIRVILKNLASLVGKCHGTRIFGTAACAIAYVGGGSVDAFCHIGMHCWDLAAGQLIVEEAGGFLCDYGGSKIFSTNKISWFSRHEYGLRCRWRADAYFEFGLHAWDMAAGDLIIREAGGVVIDTTGGPFDIMSRRVVCAASEPLAKSIANLLEQYELERD